MILKLHLKRQADLSHFINMPLGTGVEVIKADSLISIEKITKEAFEREHITTHYYNHLDKYTVIEERCGPQYYLPNFKISLDSEVDYFLIKRAFNALYKNRPIEADELVKWLKRHEKTSTKEIVNENIYLPKQHSR